MTTQRWKYCAGILALMLAFVIAGCKRETTSNVRPETGGAKKLTIGVSLMNLSSEFIVLINKAMEERAKELDVKLIANDAQRSADKQVQQIENFIAQKVDAIILNPCEVEASSPAVDKAIAAGIPVINVNSVTKSVPTAFAGSRDEESGKIAMEYIVKRLAGTGNVLIMQGYMGQAAQIKRDKGADEILAGNSGIKVLAHQTAEWDRAKAMSLMENWIQTFGAKINAVYAHNDEMAMGAVIALENAKLKDKIVVVGVDAIADALQAVKAGRLDATVFQDAAGQGRTAVELAVKVAKKEPFEKETFIPFQLVTKENITQFIK
ncbi:MAG: sugar ABC transporter substrate-binding protein [Kiritimatiellae bacterium]|nr:sugar ABC transporter substrate-binding protein [Kiritimatiellia bacterium]MDD5520983.1 sugar ABC transporter substrate-binding protein [Kiritimatiellia bacterium]